MQIALLGQLAVQLDGVAVAIDAAKERAVLSLLALRGGTPASSDEIIDALWGESPPRSARKAVQTYVANLRRVLPPAAITTTTNGYSLACDEVDTARFERLVGESRQLAGAGAGDAAITALTDALALWRGAALPDLIGQPLGGAEATRLDELRRSAEEDLADLRLARGEHNALIPDLESNVTAEPLRERRWGQLMLAMYRGGRQADALRAYQRLRRHLTELGIEPGRQLGELEDAILLQKPSLDWTGPPSFGPARGHGPVVQQPRRLPVAANSFVGRVAECAAVTNLLGRARLVTIVGPGGSGKTRLALEVANGRLDHFDGNVVIAPLGSARPGDVARHVAAAAGVIEEPGCHLVDTLAAALARRCLLVVLDNCEHVVDDAANVAETLVSSCSRISILATSREALRCPSEHRVPLNPLSPDAAVQLFLDRARAAHPATQLEDQTELIGRLCQRLDYLPLALEIAAARLETLTPAELVAGLDDRFTILTGGARTAEDRHRTLRAAIDWSYQLLDDDEQALLCRLGVFVGGVGLPELAAVSGGRDPGSLIQKSLVVPAGDFSSRRLSLHETIRQYALDRLDRTADGPTIRRAHADAYLTLAETSAPHLRGPEQRHWFERLDADRGNVAAALAWADRHSANQPGAAALGLRLCSTLWWYWFRTNQAADGLARLDAAINAGPDRDATALGAAGYLAWITDDFPAATAYADRALNVRDASPASRALALGVRARVYGDRGEFPAALETALASECLYLEAGDPWFIFWARRCRASIALYGGDTDQAGALTTDAMDRFRELGDSWAVAGCLDLLAVIAIRNGDSREAFRLAQESVSCHRTFTDFTGIRTSLLHLADVARQLGDIGTAQRAGRESLELSIEHGYRMGAMHAHLLLAEVATEQAEVVSHARESAKLARQLGDERALAAADTILASSDVTP